MDLRSRLGRRREPVADEQATGEDATATQPTRSKRPDGAGGGGGARAASAVVRTRVAQLVWIACVLLALVLAVGALLVALDSANRDNSLVRFVLDLADNVDLGVFSRENGVLTFDGENAETKNALVNWGLGAVVYLVVGRIVERVVRP